MQFQSLNFTSWFWFFRNWFSGWDMKICVILLHVHNQDFQHHLLKLLSFINVHFCQKSVGCSCTVRNVSIQFFSIDRQFLFRQYAVLLLWLYSLIQNQVLWYLYHCSFLPKIAFAVQCLLCFHMHFKISFSISMRNRVSILIGILLNL